jgi:hypothetical protein
MKTLAFLVLVFPGVASADIGEPAPPDASIVEPAPPAEVPVADPPSAPVALSPLEQCHQRRSEIGLRAQATTNLEARTQLLESMPDCTHAEALRLAAIEPPAPSVSRPPGAHAGGSDIGIGLGQITAGYGVSLTGVALSFGVGGSVAKDVVLSARVAGVMSFDGAVMYVGFAGPAVQFWPAPNVWLGGGIGLGFLAGCGGGGCGEAHTTGFDIRAGYAFSSHGHVAVEVTTANGINTIGLTLGTQAF